MPTLAFSVTNTKKEGGNQQLVKSKNVEEVKIIYWNLSKDIEGTVWFDNLKTKSSHLFDDIISTLDVFLLHRLRRFYQRSRLLLQHVRPWCFAAVTKYW